MDQKRGSPGGGRGQWRKKLCTPCSAHRAQAGVSLGDCLSEDPGSPVCPLGWQSAALPHHLHSRETGPSAPCSRGIFPAGLLAITISPARLVRKLRILGRGGAWGEGRVVCSLSALGHGPGSRFPDERVGKPSGGPRLGPRETRVLRGCALERDLAVPEGLCCAQEGQNLAVPLVFRLGMKSGAKLHEMLVPITAR